VTKDRVANCDWYNLKDPRNSNDPTCFKCKGSMNFEFMDDACVNSLPNCMSSFMSSCAICNPWTNGYTDKGSGCKV
jgi:hypothetical protein